ERPGKRLGQWQLKGAVRVVKRLVQRRINALINQPVKSMADGRLNGLVHRPVSGLVIDLRFDTFRPFISMSGAAARLKDAVGWAFLDVGLSDDWGLANRRAGFLVRLLSVRRFSIRSFFYRVFLRIFCRLLSKSESRRNLSRSSPPTQSQIGADRNLEVERCESLRSYGADSTGEAAVVCGASADFFCEECGWVCVLCARSCTASSHELTEITAIGGAIAGTIAQIDEAHGDAEGAVFEGAEAGGRQ